QNRKGSQQYHGNGDRRNQCCTEVLQEEIHYEKYQDDRFDQCLHYGIDRKLHKRCCIVGVNNLEVRREERRKLVNSGTHSVGSIQCVSTRCERNGHTRCGLIVVLSFKRIVLTTQFDPGYIFQADLGTVLINTQQDVAELFRCRKTSLHHDTGVDLLTGNRRSATQLTGRDLRVLCLDSTGNITGYQTICGQLVGIQPDTHRILRTKQRDLSYTIHPAQLVLHVGSHIVGNIIFVHAVIGRNKADNHQEASRRFGHAHTLLLYFLRQQRHDGLQLVLHLDLRDIRISTSQEGNSNFTGTTGFTGR